MRIAGISIRRSRSTATTPNPSISRHVIINHKTAGGRQAIFVQQFVAVGISAHLETFDLHQELKRISYGGVIVHYKYDLPGIRR